MPHILVSSFLPPQNGLAHGQDPDSKSCKDTQSLVSGAFDPPGPRAQHRLHARQNQASSKVNGGAHSYKSSPPYINYSSTPVLSTTSTRPLRESIEMHLPRPRLTGALSFFTPRPSFPPFLGLAAMCAAWGDGARHSA
eukprot:scaffold148671_cov18-Tisochrysis_lutea.AAC.2